MIGVFSIQEIHSGPYSENHAVAAATINKSFFLLCGSAVTCSLLSSLLCLTKRLMRRFPLKLIFNAAKLFTFVMLYF